MKLLDPRDLDVLLESTKAKIDEPVTMTVRWIAKDGRVVWTQHRCIKRLHDDGSVVLVGAARDVTEQREIEERYRLLAETGSDVVVVGGNDGTITWISPSVEGLLGWHPSEMVGTDVPGYIHEDDRGAVSAAQASLSEGREAGFDVRMRRKHGDFRWINIRVRPMHDDKGNVVGRVGAWRDAQWDHDLAEQVERERRQYQLLAENSSDIVALINVDGTLEWASPSVERILGWAPNALIGTRPWDIVHPDDHDAAAASLAEAGIGNVDPQPINVRFRTTFGSYLWMSALGHHADAGRMVVSFRLVEEEVRARQELKRSEDRYRLLAENASDVVTAPMRSDASRGSPRPSPTPSVGRSTRWSAGRSLTSCVRRRSSAAPTTARPSTRRGATSPRLRDTSSNYGPRPAHTAGSPAGGHPSVTNSDSRPAWSLGSRT